MRRPTSADVAERAGVSRATVSMVLNDRVKGTVAEPTRRRVLEAAEELGYTRSAAALSLQQRRTHTIGLTTDEIATSPCAARMARAASGPAARDGATMLPRAVALGDTSGADAVRRGSERQVGGLVDAAMGRLLVPRPKVPAEAPVVMLDCEPRARDDGPGELRAFL